MKMDHAWAFAMCGVLAVGAVPFIAGAVAPVGEMQMRDVELDTLLTRTAQRAASSFKGSERSFGNILMDASYDLGKNTVTLNVRRGYMPDYPGAEFEDFEQWVGNSIREAMAAISSAIEISFRYEGRSFEDLFPDEVRAEPKAVNSTSVMVAAGHGIYFHHGYKDWRPQRDPSNGITEDELTPLLASELADLLRSRSATEVVRARDGGNDNHVASGQAWWKIAARYRLQRDIPEQTAVWHSLPGSMAALRERNEDIRSRPLYANHVGVGALLHLHTNASESTAASGSRVYVTPARTADLALGTSILCYMREIITSQEGYSTFAVPSNPATAAHGENRLAGMPSAIVEVGFHTNPADALALQDPVFRTASMKGVEKGYRLWREGKGCTPLALQRVTDVTLPPHTVGKAEVHFEGHPRFPVTMEITSLECPQGSTCDSGEEIKEKPMDSPLTFEIGCGRGDHTRISQWQTVLRDDDGVRSAPAQHQLTCTGPGESADPSRPERHGSQVARIRMR